MSPVTQIVTFGASPVRISAESALKVAAVNFHLVRTAASPAFVGTSGLNKTTLDGVITEIAPGDPDFTIANQDTYNSLHPSDYWVDGAAGEKMLVTLWLA